MIVCPRRLHYKRRRLYLIYLIIIIRPFLAGIRDIIGDAKSIVAFKDLKKKTIIMDIIVAEDSLLQNVYFNFIEMRGLMTHPKWG